MMIIIQIVLCCCFLATALCTAPGFELRITQRGLDYAKEVEVNILLQKIHGQKIPDRSGSHYSLSGMYITNFQLPHTALGLLPGSGFKFSFTDAYASVFGHWHYEMLFVSDSGTFDATISGMALSLGVHVTSDATGRPAVSENGCGCWIPNIDITLHGGASWLYNIFVPLVENSIRDHLQNQICQTVLDGISNLERNLQEISMTSKVDEFTEVDYTLVSPPDITAITIDMNCKGEFYSLAHRAEFPKPPPPMDLGASADRMLYFGLSQYLFNSAGFAYHTSDALKCVVNDQMLPKDAPLHLNISSLAILMPKLRKMFPDLPVELLIASREPPSLLMTAGNLSLCVDAAVDVVAVWPNSSQAFLFSLDVNVSLTTKLTIDADKLHGILALDSIKISELKSAVGSVPVMAFQLGIKFITEKIVLPKVNGRLQKGIPLPMMKNVRLVNAQLLNKEKFVVVGMDLKYEP
ncbi:bactericidal permeability-increasing protein-like [Lampetra planeri]